MPPYRNLARHWRERLGATAWKVPLDAGLGCPNRDGTISRSGCVFCNPRGSGTGLASEELGGLSLAEQWESRGRSVRPGALRIAYLQSFTNTHCPPGRLAAILDELAALPGLAGACIGTRPDCLEPPKLDLLARFAESLARDIPGVETWLDLGLQSSDDATLSRINRGHDAACFADAACRAAGAGLKVCAHVMAGLPGEDAEALWATVDFVAALPVAGIKFHNTMVVRGATLEAWWREGRYEPPPMEDYASAVAVALARLRPDMVVHRLVADPAPGELLAPDWAADKHAVLARIRGIMEARGLRQGSRWDPPRSRHYAEDDR